MRARIRSPRVSRYILLAADISALLGAFIISLAVAGYRAIASQPVWGDPGVWIGWFEEFGRGRLIGFGAMAMVLVAVFWFEGAYTRRRPFWDEIHDCWKTIIVVGVTELAALFWFEVSASRFWVVVTWGLALVTVPVARIVVKRMMNHFGVWSRPTVIIGTGAAAQDAASVLIEDVLLGYYVSLFIEPPRSWETQRDALKESIQPESVIAVGVHKVPVLRGVEDIVQTLEELGNPNVVVALDSVSMDRISTLLHEISDTNASINIVPPLKGMPITGAEVLHFFRREVFFVHIKNNLSRKTAQSIKRLFDVLVSTIAIVFLSPVFCVLSLAIKRSGSNVIFSHERVGQHGSPFRCHKFQTMVHNADEVLKDLLNSSEAARQEWESEFKLKNDPRITRVGHFLRKTSLDELPQLWNVLKGEMSLVGPRPITATETVRYNSYLSYYLQCRPGITGIWQVSGRSKTSYAERVQLDVWYAKNWHLWYDIVILFRTFSVLWKRDEAY